MAPFGEGVLFFSSLSFQPTVAMNLVALRVFAAPLNHKSMKHTLRKESANCELFLHEAD